MLNLREPSFEALVSSPGPDYRGRLMRPPAAGRQTAVQSEQTTDNLGNYFYCQLPEINTVYIECSALHSSASPLMSGWLVSCLRMFNIWPRNKTDLPGSSSNAGPGPRGIYIKMVSSAGGKHRRPSQSKRDRMVDTKIFGVTEKYLPRISSW